MAALNEAGKVKSICKHFGASVGTRACESADAKGQNSRDVSMTSSLGCVNVHVN